MKLTAVVAAFSIFAAPVFALPQPLFITIDHVELKTAGGAWVSVIRPDKKIDLFTTDPTIAFFNNQGRIPAGGYVNVRLSVSGETPFQLSAKNDFPALSIKKGSFVRVRFKLDLKKPMADAIESLSLIADEERRDFGSAETAMDT